ncbi:hypothetical protein BRD00_08245 [Halobacteriales archaeon QS_8_69_26]|nr:MAG: hypothetical protein BRD00_08245 [Halobacteriales archaeon QS_8_69_26]
MMAALQDIRPQDQPGVLIEEFLLTIGKHIRWQQDGFTSIPDHEHKCVLIDTVTSFDEVLTGGIENIHALVTEIVGES